MLLAWLTVLRAHKHWLGAVALLAAAAATRGCSSDEGGTPTTSTNGTGASGGGGQGGATGTTTSTTTAPDPCAVDAACASTVVQAEPFDAAIYVLVDRSGSMLPDRWPAAVEALESFLGSAGSAGLNVALGLFPQPQQCNLASYETPVVELGLLTAEAAPEDEHEQKLRDALHDPDLAPVEGQGKTPIYSALAGTYEAAGAHMTQSGDKRVAVVLITDGEPDACPNDIKENIVKLAAAKLLEGVRTLVVGLPGIADPEFLASLAAAGGSGSAYIIGQDELTNELADALHDLQVDYVGCDIPIPESSVGTDFINVCYAPGGENEAAVGWVDGVASCTNAGGWYFDDPADPKYAKLCPSTCTAVQSDAKAEVELVLGCPLR